MQSRIHSVIVGTGSYVPKKIVRNQDFLKHKFFEKNGELILRDNQDIITKFQDITEIEERCYADEEYVASDLGYFSLGSTASIMLCEIERLLKLKS